MRHEASPTSSLVDRKALERVVAKKVARPISRMLGSAAFALSMTLGPTVLSPLAFGEGWEGVAAYVRAEPWASLWLPLILAAVIVIASAVSQFGRAARDTSRIARRIERDWRLLTEGRWVTRTILLGVLMGCCVGFPIGTLLAFDARPGELLEAGGRFGIVLSFVAMTLVWTVPAAFWIRFMALREYRPLLRSGQQVARCGSDA
jgi:hypothetical protein